MSSTERETGYQDEALVGAAGDPDATPATTLRGTQALERLRERVEQAARELERLRRDNMLLAKRIAELEARPSVDEDQTFFLFDENTDALRKKVEGFIQAIDAHLERERAREAEQ